MASCATFATETLFATSVNTVVQDGEPSLVTITEGDTVATITSFNPPITQSFTSVQATATLFATRCPSNVRNSAPAATSTTTSAATTTYERSSTNAGGNVVVQTIVETIQRNGTVIQTQTSAPPPSATLVDNTASTATGNKQHTGAIAGGIVGGVVALLALLLCLWFVRKRRRNALHSRNLDDFFSDPTAAGWQDKSAAAAAAGAGLGARRTGTLRSMRSQSAIVLDLEKERDSSAARNGEGHWAAMEPVEDHEDVVTTTRPQSRQSLNTLGRPMSFHSMSIGHGLDAVGDGGEDPIDAVLLRNDSDRSSKSNVIRDELANGPRSPRSPDLVPAYYGYTSSPPPISPTSSPPPLSPYGSPLPLQDSTLYEGWSAESEARNRAAVQRYNSVSGSLRAGRSSFGSGVAMLNTTAAAKPRTWSNGALQQADVVQRPRSAQGLACNGLNNVGSENTTAYNAGFAARVMQYHSMQSPSPPLSPSMSATNTNGALRGRASLSGVTVHYPHAAAYGASSRSPPSSAFASSPTSAFPPSQYAHLDVHKTEEEREEDMNTALPASAIPVNGAVDVQDRTRARLQRRHQSLSNDILLRVVNPSLEPSQQQQQQQQGERTNDVTRTLSIRNAD